MDNSQHSVFITPKWSAIQLGIYRCELLSDNSIRDIFYRCSVECFLYICMDAYKWFQSTTKNFCKILNSTPWVDCRAITDRVSRYLINNHIIEPSFTVVLNGSWCGRSLCRSAAMRRYDRGLRGAARRACRPARNNNRKFYAPGQCDIKLSVRSNNRTEQPGLNAGQSLATRDNGAGGPLTLEEKCARRCPVTKRQCNIHLARMCLLRRAGLIPPASEY